MANYSLRGLFESRSRIPGGNTSTIMSIANFGGASTATESGKGAVLVNSDIHAVASLITSDLASATFSGANAKAINELNKPNDRLSKFNFWQAVYLSMLLTGNAYVTKINGHYELVPTENVTLNFDEETRVLTYMITLSGHDYQVNAGDMLHFKIMTLNTGTVGSELIGHSPLEALKAELTQASYSSRLATNQLAHAITPTPVITVPQGTLAKEAKEALRQEFEKINAGDNSGRAIVLDQAASLSYQSVDNDLTDLLRTVSVSRTQIAKAFGIPDNYLNGQGDQQSSMSMAKSQYINSLNRYIEPVNSELQLKLGDVSLDTQDIFDYDASQILADTIAMTTAEIITPDVANAILRSKGVIPSGN